MALVTRAWSTLICLLAALAALPGGSLARNAPAGCPARPAQGSTVAEPLDLHGLNGVLRVDLRYRKSTDAAGHPRYCYVHGDGSEAPTLRLSPGDLLILRLKNETTAAPETVAQEMAAPDMAAPGTGAPQQHPLAGGCTSSPMTATATNLHFHGLTVPPKCHQDDVLNTLIPAGGRPFEYRFRIPSDEPPGLYWYHPHVHGMTSPQVLGGASGALIVEGIERADPTLAGLPERVFIIRDQDLLNPTAQPVQTDSMPAPLMMRDAEGDIRNTGTGGGKPAKDLSINFVPVPYPRYSPAVIAIRPGERELWRILNASAITYLDLQLLIEQKPMGLGVVALDGVPIDPRAADPNHVLWQSHVLLPPAARVELIAQGPPAGAKASLVTRTVDTGPAGENDPTRPLATIISDPRAPEPRERLAASPAPLPRSRSVWLGDAPPARTRRLYFSEKPRDPGDPASLTDFYLTVDGQQPKLFDPRSKTPDIVARQGDVEDWIIENRTQELHAFHIHQIHFMLVQFNGIPLREPFLRDTINVPYWDGRSSVYPSVRLRMDFRDPNVVGTFPYHCHLLEHEDGGMMGLIRVDPRGSVR